MVHLTTALDAASDVPLYEQLYRSLAAEMRTGAVPAGTRMPGKRRLAAELSVSVNTVDAAYQMLAAEGYLESPERRGVFLKEYIAQPTPPARLPPRPRPPGGGGAPGRGGFSRLFRPRPGGGPPRALRAVTGTLHKGRTGRDAGPAFHKNLPNGGKV